MVKKKKSKKRNKKYTITYSIQNDAIFLIFGVIVGFIIPFLFWLIIVNYFYIYLKY